MITAHNYDYVISREANYEYDHDFTNFLEANYDYDYDYTVQV